MSDIDTFDDNWVPSGIAFDDMDPGAPDARGYSSGSAVFATGSIRVDGGTVTTRDKTGEHVDYSGASAIVPEP